MSTSFEGDRELARDQIAAIIEAEIIANPALAQQYDGLLRRCLVRPAVVGCQQHSDPSAAGLIPLWLVFEEPPARGDRYFIVYDPNRSGFGIGVWEGQRAWFVEGCGRFFEMLERLSADGH